MQFYGRLWFRIHRPRSDTSPAPPLRPQTGRWIPPARREPTVVGPDTFLFLGEEGSLQEVGWDGPARDKLWRYNQHYFDDLNAQDGEDRTGWHRELLSSWIVANPPGSGNGWEPYPASLRIVNWIKWALAGHTLPGECLRSLAVQARWLSRRVELHLLGNHLFANAKALVFAGLFFAGPEARRWLEAGLRILRKQLPEQVLQDGGHFERSTMYHALALEDVLDLCNLAAAYRGAAGVDLAGDDARWRERSSSMQSWLTTMRHPDGEIAFFNDAAFGIAPSCAELDAYADRLGFKRPETEATRSRHLLESGYVRLAIEDAVAVLDVAPVGPDYLPGHAHADTLSFEFSVHGQRLLVNSGTSCYGSSPERQRQRGTPAHNTVSVGGLDSSEVWSAFRVARRARPVEVSVHTGTAPLRVRAGHDGYMRLPGQPMHRRHWELARGRLVVEDSVSVTTLDAEARFHFHPAVLLRTRGRAGEGEAILPGGQRLGWRVELGTVRLERSTWHPRFGVSVANHCIAVRLAQGCGRMVFTWDAPADDDKKQTCTSSS